MIERFPWGLRIRFGRRCPFSVQQWGQLKRIELGPLCLYVLPCWLGPIRVYRPILVHTLGRNEHTVYRSPDVRRYLVNG